MTNKLNAGDALPEMTLPLVGDGEVKIGGARDDWQMVVVYRGQHCPICKRYLTGLKDLVEGYREAGTEIVAVSADTEPQAAGFTDELGLDFDVAYGMTEDQMKALGLYISNPRSEQETDHRFPEPGLFVVRPDGRAQIIDISNAPFARPDLGNLLNGLKFIQEKDYPIRGTAA